MTTQNSMLNSMVFFYYFQSFSFDQSIRVHHSDNMDYVYNQYWPEDFCDEIDLVRMFTEASFK